ncbi:diguanylate cyclase [Frankia sp. CNm7]|uniref:Diguanylate cyclase n=1 Tax=Frankia nepalensis TaxID=1836974 RepID=A0A937REI7_9ACTN|nr:diguanylate cyclase [Frankia nepalensis]MBL7500054.1 diguanylate cyclase [Frankia nepalensis]MBL7511517.1 diguanylate cyclase [Frankia nepalensis]MBL7520937.1 diguanylate cyclase [Frankia nepalensis]MBL7628542.1 diguanylate cyclase [Frankia nepalensis]
MLAIGTVILALSAVLPLPFLDGREQLIFQATTMIFAAVAAAVVAMVGVARTRGPDRRWRLLVGTIPITSVFGAADWVRQYAVLRIPEATLGRADLVYLLPCAIILAGLLWIPTKVDGGDVSRGPPRRRVGRPRYSDALVALDGLVIMVSMLLIVWIVVLGKIVSGDLPGLSFAIAMAISLGGMLALIVVMLVGTFRQPRNGRSLALLGIGLAVLLAPEAQTVNLSIEHAPEIDATAPYWACLAVGPPLLALAIVVPERRRQAGSSGDDLTRPRTGRVGWPWAHNYVPYLPLGAAAVIIVGLAASGAALGGAALFLTLILATLVAVRQLITVAQNIRLLATLQAAHDQVRYQAFHDPLTGLPNRAHFTRELERAIADHQSGGQAVGVLFVDLDGFKSVNDTLGHGAGDDLLRAVAERLREAVRRDDLVARLGGDEFAVLITETEHASTPTVLGRRIGERILAAMSPPFTIHGHLRYMGASVGLATADLGQPADDAEQLLHQADSAMYAAKHGAKGSLVTHYPRGSATADADDLSGSSLAAKLMGDATPGALTVCYQPIRCLRDGRTAAVEAMLCWTQASGAPIPARELLGVAERDGLADDLDGYLRERACRDLPAIRDRLGAPVRLHLNVSPGSVGRREFVDRVEESLRRHHLGAGTLVLEIERTARIPDLTAAETILGWLTGTGVDIALDGVGALDSSLGALYRLPVSLIKLDRALSADLLSAGQASRRTVPPARKALIDFAAATGLTVVADGIVTQPQLDTLRAAGCDFGQGSLLGPPQPLQELAGRSGNWPNWPAAALTEG